MTTTTLTMASRANGPLTRIANVAKLHFTNKWNLLVLPWLILGLIFLVNYLIWWIVRTANGNETPRGLTQGTQYSGATFYIFVYMLVLAIQAVTLTFSFALSYSVTRRDYYLGTSAAFILVCVMYATGMTILASIEDATGGWGLGGHIFRTIYVGDGDWWTSFFVYFVGLMFFIFVGTLYGTVYMRWRLNGTVALGALMALAAVGAVALITFTDGWPAVGAWFVASGPVGVAAWLLVPAAIIGVLGFFILRRATPKS